MNKTWPCIYCGSLSDTQGYVCSRCDPLKDKRILTVEDIQRLQEAEAQKGKREKKRKIVIIEQDKSFALSMAIFFQRSGYEAIVADSSFDGLSVVHREKPAVLILGAMMSPLSGYDFLSRLYEKGFSTDRTAVIVITDWEDTQGMMGPWNIQAFMQKPVNPDELLREVERALN